MMHGFGYMGATGANDEEQRLSGRYWFVFQHLLKKHVGSIGALLSVQNVLKYLRYNVRRDIAKSPPLVYAEGMLRRMEMVKSMPELREN